MSHQTRPYVSLLLLLLLHPPSSSVQSARYTAIQPHFTTNPHPSVTKTAGKQHPCPTFSPLQSTLLAPVALIKLSVSTGGRSLALGRLSCPGPGGASRRFPTTRHSDILGTEGRAEENYKYLRLACSKPRSCAFSHPEGIGLRGDGRKVYEVMMIWIHLQMSFTTRRSRSWRSSGNLFL